MSPIQRRIALLLLGVACPTVTFAEPDPCDAFRDLPIPTSDQPTAADRERLKLCSAELYAVDAEAALLRDARLCAFLEREAEESPPDGGPGVLMMVYANGLGVTRDYGLARRFACEIDGAPAELEGRLEHLDNLAQLGGDPIDICDDITSGYMAGVCATHTSGALAVIRDQKMADLQKPWPAAKKDAFPALRQAASAYFEARMGNEVDLSGTARGAFQLEEEDAREDAFLASLQAFEAGQLPQGDAKTLAAADAELNAVYAKLMKAAQSEKDTDNMSSFGSIRREGIRETERAWIAYRDAWATFGQAAYPKIPRDAWLTWQTRERTAMLQELLELAD